MSGVVTPLLDTLLHQVLGKRVDTLASRELLEPVKPLSPGQAPRALHSDSRLHAERGTVAFTGAELGSSGERTSSSSSPTSIPASTTTHFSPAARSIADILFKFPAPPSVIKPSAPLLTGTIDQGVINASALASRLQGSIETSGLFYESHLARWYRGDLSRGALLREPQMQLLLSREAAGNMSLTKPGQPGDVAPTGHPLNDRRVALAGMAGERWTLTPLPNGATTSSLLTPLSPVQAAGAFLTSQESAQSFVQRGESPVDTAHRMPIGGMDAFDESLQGILRHQLELLVTPTLRWEGDLWSGLFMALVIQVPEQLAEHAEQGKEQGQDEKDQDAVWHSQLKLELPRLGELEVQFHLRDTSLRLILQSESAACTGLLNDERDALSERLQRCGFAEVHVSVLTKVKGSDTDPSGEKSS